MQHSADHLPYRQLIQKNEMEYHGFAQYAARHSKVAHTDAFSQPYLR